MPSPAKRDQEPDSQVVQPSEQQAELAALSLELQESRSKERNELAVRLHGDLGQLLAALRINLNLLQQQLAQSAESTQTAESMDRLLLASIASLRQVSAELKPKGLADGDLYSALQSLQQEALRRFGLQCELTCNEFELQMDEPTCQAVYGMLEDLVCNAIAYAELPMCSLDLARSAGFLHVSLSGAGALVKQPDVAGYRLAGARERVRRMNGSMEIVQQGTKNFRIDMSLPLSGAAPHI